MNKDYYEILGVSKDADSKAIKNAHRKLVKKYHPDISKEPDAQERFKEVQEAYDVLSDQEKRAQYDKYGHDSYNQGASYTRQQYSGFSGWDSHSMGNSANVQFIKFKDLPLWKKILWVIGLLIAGFFIIVIFLIIMLIRFIINIIQSIFK